MVIAEISCAFGNQFYQYALGRALAHKLNTELKLDLHMLELQCTSSNPQIWLYYYRLGNFNILESLATPEEITHVKNNGVVLNSYPDFQALKPKLENFQGDIFILGYWMFSENIFADIIDIIRKDFTLKNPLNPNAEAWKQKILSAKCSVSMHFRHGDKIYDPYVQSLQQGWTVTLPLDYYYTCINILKQKYSDLTVFVFSNNLQWVKENLRLDVSTEFVEGCETDDEEWILMSLCKHNIVANSTFGKSAASLNANPDKKIFFPAQSDSKGFKQYLDSLTAAKKDALLRSNTWIKVLFDSYSTQEVTMRPYFSILLVVNNDAETISETLNSILNQDYKYYEVVIIDNASTDGSGNICQEVIQGRENVTFKKLWTKVKNGEAWNMALNMTQRGGYYISFLKGNDRFLTNALTNFYPINLNVVIRYQSEPSAVQNIAFFHTFTWLEQNDTGTVKYFRQCDAHFKNENRWRVLSSNAQEAAKLLLNEQINRFLGTKIYSREFLTDNGIKFDEYLDDDDAELSFQMECFLKSKNFLYIGKTCYIAPKNSLEQYPGVKFHDVSNEDAQIVRKFNRYFTARIDIRLKPKTNVEDFPILFVSDDRAMVLKNAGWLSKEGNLGHSIQSYVGKLEFVVKATVEGKIVLSFKGINGGFTDGDNPKRIPYWIDYTRLTINGKIILDKITPTWHDKPFVYNMDVKAGEEITVQVEWLPHRSDT